MKSKKQMLFITGFVIPEYKYIYDDLITKLGIIFDIHVIYLFTNIQIKETIRQILSYKKKTIVLLYSTAYIFYDYIKTYFRCIFLWGPYRITPIVILALKSSRHFFTDKLLIELSRNIIHKHITCDINNYYILNHVYELFTKVNDFIESGFNKQDEILDNTYVIVGVNDILTNIVIPFHNIIYINGLHVLTRDEEAQIVNIIKLYI
jgi:hypothetical protein